MRIVLREELPYDLFDYAQLSSVLSSYANVRGKIGRLLASGEIIRLKKGLYTFPEYLRRAPLNPCIVANMLYGPSYVSRDFALSYYGMIPETVEIVTSMTTGRPRRFQTPVGTFDYKQRQAADFSIGIENIDSGNGAFLIAGREKALYDKVLTDKRFDGKDVESYLLQDLRLNHDSLASLNLNQLQELRTVARGRMSALLDFLIGLCR
ncbi:MAG: type IV toxin-antitoxin system AbiEi family antitoxin domain-containing protein [Lentisphaeria bacterium]|mgnify:CR=1 FL=1|jgi:predicted transcriptional regulator of viral defense system